MCGELAPPASACGSPRGSSPRVRGTPVLLLADYFIGRFIPACAGNSHPPTLPSQQEAVHPRVCGELTYFGAAAAAASGSSPRVRGTRQPRRTPLSAVWFIPACAGNSRKQLPTKRGRAVHPRVCGELCSLCSLRSLCYGSSPRVRGTRRPIAAAEAATPVHPRVCGELVTSARRTRSTDGSSPRVRGTPLA